MDIFSIRRQDLDGILGFSCIENYVLATLSKSFCHTYLYFDSFASIYAIFDETIFSGIGFAFIKSIQRIQHIAAHEGIIKYKKWKATSIQDAFLPDSYTCVEVFPWWYKKRYQENTWRNDHYILIEKQNEKSFFILNDIPRDDALINSDDACSLFAGGVFSYSILNVSVETRKQYFMNRFLARLKKNNTTINFPDNIPLLNFRDFLGVMKISRKRVAQFCGNYFSTSFMDEYLNYLDMCYNRVEYMRLRNKQDNDTILDIQKNLIDHDAMIISKIMKLIGGLDYGYK